MIDFWKAARTFLGIIPEHTELFQTIQSEMPPNVLLSGGFLTSLLYDSTFVFNIVNLGLDQFTTLDIDLFTYSPMSGKYQVSDYDDPKESHINWASDMIAFVVAIFRCGGTLISTNHSFFYTESLNSEHNELPSHNFMVA